MNIEKKIMLYGLLLGLAAFVFDAVLDHFIFYEGTFLGLLITDIPAHELYIHMFILLSFVCFSAIIARHISKLKKAELEFKSAFNHSPDMICVCTPEGKLLKVSPSCQRVLGYTQEEILKIGWAKFVHPDDVESTNKEVAKQLEGGSVANFVNRYKHKDGSYRILEWQATPSIDGTVYATAQDITERKRAEESLRNEKLLSEEYINSLPGLFYVFDEERFVRWNKQWEKVTGYSTKELATKYGTDFFEGNDRTLIGERMLEVFCDGVSEAEAELVTKDGRRIPYYFTGLRKKINGKYHLVGLGIDITKRKQAEDTLKKSQGLLAETERMGKVGGWEFNIDTGKQTWTEETYNIHELDRTYEPTVEKGVNFYTPASRPIIERAVQRAIEHGGSFDVELEIMTAKGNLRSVHVIGKADFEHRRVYGFFQDITERKRLEETQKQQFAQLAHMSRLTTAGELSSSLAHELNQPLCAIATISEGCKKLISSGKTRGDDIKEGIDEISAQAARAGEIIRRMGKFVSKHGPKRSIVDLNTVISESIGLIGVQVRQANVNIHYKCPNKVINILADRIQLQQVFINLMQNGVDAMEEIKPEQRRLSLSTSISKKGFVEIVIKDNGKGFSEIDKELLFQPFFTTKPEGMGIGLAISRSIVEAHGGHLSAESKPGDGSTFKIKMPLGEYEKNNES